MWSFRAAVAAPCLGLALLVGGAAHASLIGQTVTVALTDGGSLFHDDDVTVGAGVELAPGDGSDIGTLLLPSERIDIGATSILLTLEEGVPGGGTGYPSGTAYVFTNLAFFGQATAITGVSLTASNITGISLGNLTFSATTLRVPIDALLIGELPGVDTGTLQIDVTFALVPEPGTALLASLGLFAVAWRARAARRSAA
jgi:PEP-CTERM motif-containing protein